MNIQICVNEYANVDNRMMSIPVCTYIYIYIHMYKHSLILKVTSGMHSLYTTLGCTMVEAKFKPHIFLSIYLI